MAKIKTETAEHHSTTDSPIASKTENTGIKSQIYTGATLPGVKSHTVFKGDIPNILNKPFIKELVIPLEKLTEFEKNVKISGSRESYCYKKSAELAAELMEE